MQTKAATKSDEMFFSDIFFQLLFSDIVCNYIIRILLKPECISYGKIKESSKEKM